MVEDAHSAKTESVLASPGDFYESFDEDAKQVAEACNIVLTARDMGTGQRVPASHTHLLLAQKTSHGR